MNDEMRWIPVNEKPPEEVDTDCLVAVALSDGRYLTVSSFWTELNGKWCFTEWNEYDGSIDELKFVAAWMPTPVYIPEED